MAGRGNLPGLTEGRRRLAGGLPGKRLLFAAPSLMMLLALTTGCTWLFYPEYEPARRLLVHEEFWSDWKDHDDWELSTNPEPPAPYVSGGALLVFTEGNTMEYRRSLSGALRIHLEWSVVEDAVNGIEPVALPDYQIRLDRPGVGISFTPFDAKGEALLEIVPDEGDRVAAPPIVAPIGPGGSPVNSGTIQVDYLPTGSDRRVSVTVPGYGLSASYTVPSNLLLGTRLSFTISGAQTSPRCVETIYVYEAD